MPFPVSSSYRVPACRLGQLGSRGVGPGGTRGRYMVGTGGLTRLSTRAPSSRAHLGDRARHGARSRHPSGAFLEVR